MSATAQLNAGTILAGRWQVQDYIGSGETGEVYGVRDMHSASNYALKLFWPSVLGHPEVWSALQQTARTASGLGVEGVARAYDFGIDANCARPFFVTERVSWASLADRVRLRGPLTPAEVASALTVLARALGAAHGIGLVHRDLKPENVFISPENPSWVRVSDFGVALLRAASPPPPGWGGTIGWVGPDAADPNARSTPAMDVFALGLVTFFALSGGALHRAARTTPIDPGALWQELIQPLSAASARARELGAALDPAFDGWFQRALSPSPEARFATVKEMASAFEAVTRGLFAPQSQNAVAIEGVAAAIAQPLIFQPEPSGMAAPERALPVAADGHPVAPQPTAVSAQYPANPDSAPSSAMPGVKRRTLGPLFIAGAVVCFSLTAVGSVALYRHQRNLADAAANASASTALAASVGSAASAATGTTFATAATPPAARPVAAAEPTSASAATPPAASPGARPVVAAQPQTNASTSPAAKAAGLAKSNPAAAIVVTPAKPAPPQTPAKPATSSVTPAKPATSSVTPAKPATSSVTPAKPATTAKAATPVTANAKPAPSPPLIQAAPAKKKCGSVFIPCK
jgi:serine/threonine-protein kinase